MRFPLIISLCCLLGMSTIALGQDKKLPRKSRKSSYQIDLQRAEQLKEKAPTKAIELLEEVVLQAQRRKDVSTTGTAYLLLGEIFEAIDQKGLAIQRYRQAVNTLDPSREAEKLASIHQRIGHLQIDLKQAEQARYSFQQCLEFAEDKKLIVKCKEGLADVELLKQNPLGSLELMDSIDQNFQTDSLENARMEARRSQSYLQQNDYKRASESFYNSVQNLPRRQKIDQKDYEPIQRAQTELLNYNELNTSDEIDLRSNTLKNTVPGAVSSEELVRENLKIAELYEQEDKFAEAEKFVEISKRVITPTTDAGAVADVYKKSSEINKRRGRINAALDDLEAYITAKEQSIEELEQNLQQQVEIIKGQKDIDLGQREYSLQEKDQQLMQTQLQTQRILIGLLSLLLLAAIIFFYFLYKNVQAKRKANQKLLLKSLRTQMNPHFIFNALNSVNNFIAKNDEKAANKFLADFSRLMRKVLDYSQKDFISFEEELELNQLYLKLEHFRFRDKFDFRFDNQLSDSLYELDIPPMLIQPFIENAVWHGLRYKEGKGQLDVTVQTRGAQIIVRIEDDGVGRKKSKALKTVNQRKYNSTGLENVNRRLALINDLYNKNYRIEVNDANPALEETGTVVEIWIPLEDRAV